MARPLLLLVDDSPRIAFIVKPFSKRPHPEVVSCRPVAEPWTCPESRSQSSLTHEPGQFAAGVPNLVLLDMHLPGPSGLELCTKLRAVSRWEILPIAILSDWHRADEIAAALEAGADYVLEKDLLCRPEEWQQRVDGILSLADGRDQESIIRLKDDCSL